MENAENPYAVLGVTSESDDKDIKKAYRKLALKYHPDRQTTEDDRVNSNDMFSKIAEAYELLTDPVKTYDWKMANPNSQHSPRRTFNRTNGPPSLQKSPGIFRRSVRSSQTPLSAGGKRTSVSSPKKTHGAYGSPSAQRNMNLPPSPGIWSQGQSPPNNGGQSTMNAPKNPSSLSPNRYGVINAPNSPGSLGPRTPRQNMTSPGASRRSVTTGQPKSPGALRQSVSVDSNGRRVTKVIRRKARDPFVIFESLMEEEYGKDYKNKAASGWNAQDDNSKRSLIKGKRNKPSAKNTFKKVDVDGDQALSKDELKQYIKSNSELYILLAKKLNLSETKCVSIATNVAFSLAMGEAGEKKYKKKGEKEKVKNELSEDEFKAFYKKYVISQKGSYEFFLRTIFAVYDSNGDGVLQRDEFEIFLEIFYKPSSFYRGKTEMPPKQDLLRMASARLDKNKDGVLDFMEVRDLLQVAAVVAAKRATASAPKASQRNKFQK
jgi:curved DNA-binding protein CbpA